MKTSEQWDFQKITSTVVTVVTLIAAASAFWGTYFNAARDIDDLKKWQATHTSTHDLISAKSEKLTDVVQDLKLTVDRHEHRLVRQEQSTAEIVSTLKEIQASMRAASGDMAALSGDMKVFKEILQRLDARVSKIGVKPDEVFGCTNDRPVWISGAGIAHDEVSPWRTTVRPVECLHSMDEASARGYRAPKVSAH